MSIDREGLAEFLRVRRGALQPEDVGLPRGRRRRAEGLRREEVAALAYMSPDYYARLERASGPQPSAQMLAAIAQALRLTRAERDHLHRLAGRPVPDRDGSTDHVAPALMRILNRLIDTPAEVVSELGETLHQTPLAAALLGDARGRVGIERSIAYRWFTEPSARLLYAEADRDALGRLWVANLRRVVGERGPDSRAARIAAELAAHSDEFRGLWARGEVDLRPETTKRFVHPEVGEITLACQTLIDPEHGHTLLVYTAEPGSVDADKLALLHVIGTQALG